MGLWVAFAFGALIGVFIGALIGRARAARLKGRGVKLVRNPPHEPPRVACPMAQLTEMLMKLLDFALRRLRDSQPPRELRIAVTETGPSLTISLWDSGTPLSVEAEQRL